jgi:signal transduction histidine kinase
MKNRVGFKILDGLILEVTDHEREITLERLATSHFSGFRRMQKRAVLLGGHFHIVGTHGIETTAIASVPVVGRFTS